MSNLLYFSLYSALASRLSSRSGKLGGWRAIPVAAVAGAVNVVVTNPLWVFTTRLQVGCAGGPWAVARSLYKEGGLPAFWAGTLPALALVANPVIQFSSYEALLAVHHRRRLAL